MMGAIVLMVASRPNLPRYNELKTQREGLRKNLLPADEWMKIVQNFGDLPSTEYQRLLEDRTTAINQILGSDFRSLLEQG